MDRRAFLKGLFASGALTALNPEIALEQLLIETSPMNDAEFMTYVYYSMNLYVDNPGATMRITDIGVEDE